MFDDQGIALQNAQTDAERIDIEKSLLKPTDNSARDGDLNPSTVAS